MKFPINWKTALTGLIGSLAIVGPEISHCIQGEPCDVVKIIGGIALGALGVSSKDKDVTGGTRPNTPRE